jgi:hypothetical protein
MDTDKLLKAIQILVKEELKQQLPLIVKEVRKSVLAEVAKQTPKAEVRKSSVIKSMLEDVEPLVGKQPSKSRPVEEKQFVKNPAINSILNEMAANGYHGAPAESGREEWPTMGNPLAGAAAGSSPSFNRASMAEMMGYGDMAGGARTGLGVQTGNEVLDKALNRDYTELVKRFNKK